MSVISDAAQPRGDIMRRLAELERQVAALSTARRLEAASVGRGGLRIRGGRLLIEDADGDAMLRAGGDPGELFLRSDLLAPLALAAFGEQITSDVVEELESSSGVSGYHDLDTVGPSQTVEVGQSRTMLVDVGCFFNIVGNGGAMGFRVTGPGETIEPRDRNSTHFNISSGSVTIGIGRTFPVVVSDPGEWTVTAKYRVVAPAGPSVGFADRSLTVIPF